MQYRPEIKDLILAIQDFLMKDLLPQLEDNDLLSYKTLVSWNMLGVLSREFQNQNLVAEWDQILNLPNQFSSLAETVSVLEFQQKTYIEQSKILFHFYKKLREEIRILAHKAEVSNKQTVVAELSPKSEIWQFCKNSLRENLKIANPRFST